jgi:PKD repeat protein
MPGNYTVKLTVNNKLYTQNFTVKMDPRVKTPMIQLQKQHDLSVICYEGSKKSMTKFPEIARKFNTLFEILVHTDMPPTKQTEKAVLETQQALLKLNTNGK